MHSRALFFAQFGVLAVMGVTHVLALTYSLYWHYIWLDMPVHFLGGLWAALVFLWWGTYSQWQWVHTPLAICAFVVAVSVGWEVFEVFVGIPREANFMFDTKLDLTMDAIGGIVGFYIGRKLTARASERVLQ